MQPFQFTVVLPNYHAAVASETELSESVHDPDDPDGAIPSGLPVCAQIILDVGSQLMCVRPTKIPLSRFQISLRLDLLITQIASSGQS